MQCLLLTQTGHGPLRIAAVQNGGGTEKVRSRHRLRTSPRIPIFKTIAFPQLIPLWENWRMRCTETPRIAALGLVLAAMSLAVPANATTLKRYGSSPIVVAQAMIPRDGMMDAHAISGAFRSPRESAISLVCRCLISTRRRWVMFRRSCELPPGRSSLLVGYSRWWGWFARPIAVPLEVLGIEGGHLVSLDMSPSEYDAAPT